MCNYIFGKNPVSGHASQLKKLKKPGFLLFLGGGTTFSEKPGFWPRITTQETQETGFFAVFGWWNDILGKTRFLATHHNSRNSRNRVFCCFWVVERHSRKNPVSGHASQLKKLKKPGFLLFLGGGTTFSEKPGFWPRITTKKLKKPGFLLFLGGVIIFSEKTRFLATHTTKETKETGFFAVFGRCKDLLGKNPVSGLQIPS
ncbi:MAG: hypothetical protein U7126_28955 [Microcoleus sp.]